MYVGADWTDSTSKKVAIYGFFEEMPVGMRRFFAFLLTGLIGMAMMAAGYAAGITPDKAFLMTSLVALAMGGLGCVFAPSWLSRKWREVEEAGLCANRHSYAFKALERELAKLKIYIHHMNDRIDHEVGIKHIVAYVRLTREPTTLIDSNKAGGVLTQQLKDAVDQYAREYATMIRYYFDQRELARQARVRGKDEEAKRIEAALQEHLAAHHSARADVWLRNYRLGLLE